MKKLISVILVLTLLLAVTAPVFSAKTAKDFTKYPTVRVAGAMHNLYNNYGTKEQYKIYDTDDGVPVPDGYIGEQIKTLLPVLLRAMVTGDYSAYAQGLVDAVTPIYADFVPDENGDVREGSGRGTVPADEDRRDENGSYGLNDYMFYDDWRLSPMVQAEHLKEYIAQVKAVTGADKINIYARCESVPIALVYLADNGSRDVAAIMFDASGANGYIAIDAVFGNEITITAPAVERFMECYAVNEFSRNPLAGVSLFKDPLTAELILETVRLAAGTKTLDVVLRIVSGLLEELRYTALPQIIMNSYGRLLSYWTMVGADSYDRAREYLLSDPKWDTFRSRTDEYFLNYGSDTAGILTDCAAAGTKIQITSEYGLAPVPVLEDWLVLTEGETATTNSSWGATGAGADSVFSDDYIVRAEKQGYAGRISADRQVDASTCLFPETTWFVKNASHNFLTSDRLWIQTAFLRSGGRMTVDSDPEFPQFLLADESEGTIEPLTKENADVTVFPEKPKTTVGVFFRMLKAQFALICSFIKKLAVK